MVSPQLTVLVCLSSCWLVADVKTSPVAVRDKRSDDGGPLQVVVDQLAQQVTSLTAQLQSVNVELQSVNAEMVTLKSRAATMDTTVAFHAWNDVNPVQALAQGTLILNHAVTNIGNAYDTTTGVFTAPVAGLYDFQASILDHNRANGDFSNTGLYVDNLIVAMAISDQGHGHYSQATMKAVVRLSVGQRVYHRNTDNKINTYYDSIGEPHTTFTGFLIRAD